MILFAGDPHGSFSHLLPFAEQYPNAALVILGDLQLTDAAELEPLANLFDLWFIHGNHDSKTATAFKNLWQSQWRSRNLHGRVVEIQGKKIAGLGGVFRGQIWMPPNNPLYFDPIHFCQYCPQERIWNGGLPLRHRTSIFPSDIEALEQQEADIFISHEAPKPHPLGFQVLNNLAKTMGVKQFFHGHHHENCVYQNHGNPFQLINVGFRSVCDENGSYLLKNIDDREGR